MSVIKVTLPLGEIPVNGKQVTFKAPCSCANTEALEIEGERYTVVDSLCNYITGSGGRWVEGATISVILDVDNKRAFLQNETGSTASNPNLLDNWYFADPINQRGQTEYAGTVYGVDRWKSTNSRLTATIKDDCINISATAVGHGYFRQELKGKFDGVFTLSVLARGTGSGFVALAGVGGTAIFTNSTAVISASTEWTLSTFTYDTANAVDNMAVGQCYFRVNSGTNFDILAVKLELGSTQTLAHQDENGNWVLNDPPPDKGLELLKCVSSKADSGDTYANSGFVNKAGDTMTGKLTISSGTIGKVTLDNTAKNSIVQLTAGTDSAGMVVHNVKTMDGAKRELILYDSAANDISKALRIRDVIDAKTTPFYDILHTGNFAQLAGGARIEVGTYQGTGGNFGDDVTNTLTFSFVPKAVVVTCRSTNILNCMGGFVWINGDRHGTTSTADDTDGTSVVELEWDDSNKSVSWSHINSDAKQLNASGIWYSYLGIG